MAEDEETAEYVGRLERAWDANREQARPKPPLSNDPDKLVAEVEQFLPAPQPHATPTCAGG